MTEPREDARDAIERAAREHRARLVGLCTRLSGGDVERAEEAVAAAFAEAVGAWDRAGVPAVPGAWLTVVARRRLADELRRVGRAQGGDDDGSADAQETPAEGEVPASTRDARLDFGSDDDVLRLLFTCCHPALAAESRVALTLHLVSGLDAFTVARAFLVPEATMAKRLTRAKAKIRDAGLPFGVSREDQVPERLEAVRLTIELVFNEGYVQARGESLDAPSLAEEALHLARELVRLVPDDTESLGLAAMLAFIHARRPARIDAAGRLVPLPRQDRSLWDAALVAEGKRLLSAAVTGGGEGPFVLRAALACEHSTARTAEATRWDRIVALYDELLEHEPSAVVRLNRAVAVGEASGPVRMLEELDDLEPDLGQYQHFHVARAEALARGARPVEARAAFARALELCTNDAERAHIAGRLGELDAGG